jgi:hypothetical protein
MYWRKYIFPFHNDNFIIILKSPFQLKKQIRHTLHLMRVDDTKYKTLTRIQDIRLFKGQFMDRDLIILLHVSCRL